MKLATRRGRRAFTLVELLIVIGIIALLIGILAPTLNRARDAARRTVCMSHVRTLTSAWVHYAVDNRGAIVSSNTWPQGWVDASGTPNAISRGLLFKYVGDEGAYRCPLDPNKSNLRTYSMNAFLYGEGSPHANYMRQIKDPSQTYVVIEEWDPRGYNVNSFMVPPTGDSWVDFPATWHMNGCNISFCDGRVEWWQWTDARTLELATFYASTPDNADLKRLQAVSRY